MPSPQFKAPFPWFGGKSKAAPIIWKRLGNTPNYVEPFAGSLAVLLSRPGWNLASTWVETVNDKDGFVSNFWRALAHDPDAVAHHADWPVNENDQHARHIWLVKQRESLTAQLEGDPDFYDAKIAGWWTWGLSVWIGSGWCSGDGPWVEQDGKRVHLGNAGRGVQRQLVHLGDAGQGEGGLQDWFRALSMRLRRVRVCSGDWARVMGPSVTTKHGLTAVVLDPPYAVQDRTELYAVDDFSIAHEVRQWAIEHGDDPLLRIVLCGYDEHEMPDGWQRVRWSGPVGYGNESKGGGNPNNRHRETLWFSPHCLKATEHKQLALELAS